jgi:glycosyltransferase involved in cell wall biosynthesis
MPEISVIICTHNPRPDYLHRTLEALKGQTLSTQQWELLLIDNASEERLAESWDLSWHPNAKHVREEELGLTFARLCGIKESCGSLLVFVDDDNLLAPDFLKQAEALAVQHPNLGAFGAGHLEPRFEVQPPSELIPMLSMLALRTVRSRVWSNNPEDYRSIPWGAGLCVTRKIASLYLELLRRLNVNEVIDRRGQQLCCGGDDLFSWASVQAGKGFGLFPELQVTHLISASRLDRRYFLRLTHDQRFSYYVLSYLLFAGKPRSINCFYIIHLILHGIRNGRFLMQCRWSGARGEADAARFISKNRLSPLRFDTAKIVAARALPEVLKGATNSRL